MKRTGFYTDDTPNIARGVMLLGATREELAQILDASEANIKAWEAKYPDFAEAMKQGGAMAAARAARTVIAKFDMAVFKANVAVQVKIDALLAKQTPDLMRAAALGKEGGVLAKLDADIAALRATLK
ncbi:MAG: hypothetical protein AABZ67_00540 [Pseudomonadota bacterium]